MNQLKQKKAGASGETASIPSRLALKKEKCPGLWTTTVEGLTHKEFHLTLEPFPGEKPAGIVRRLATVLQEQNAIVVRHEIFGSAAEHQEIMRALCQVIRNFDWPVM